MPYRYTGIGRLIDWLSCIFCHLIVSAFVELYWMIFFLDIPRSQSLHYSGKRHSRSRTRRIKHSRCPIIRRNRSRWWRCRTNSTTACDQSWETRKSWNCPTRTTRRAWLSFFPTRTPVWRHWKPRWLPRPWTPPWRAPWASHAVGPCNSSFRGSKSTRNTIWWTRCRPWASKRPFLTRRTSPGSAGRKTWRFRKSCRKCLSVRGKKLKLWKFCWILWVFCPAVFGHFFDAPGNHPRGAIFRGWIFRSRSFGLIDCLTVS